MQFPFNHIETKYTAPISGTVISIWQSIAFADIMHTAVCAAIGTTVSFSLSWALRLLLKKRKEKEREG